MKASLHLLVVMSALTAAGCGLAEEIREETRGYQWQEATSSTGNYVAEFPAKPSTETQDVPGSDFSIELTGVEVQDNFYSVSEVALNGVPPYPLDVAVDGSIERMRAAEEETTGGPVTATETSRTTGEFHGEETREYSVIMTGEDGKWTIDSVMFYRNDHIVQAIVVSEGEPNADAVDRFLSSLRVST